VNRYSELLRHNPAIAPDKRDILADYVLRAFGPEADTGRPHRVMMLIFEGEDAIKKIYATAGSFDDTQESSDTVRGTYGDWARSSGAAPSRSRSTARSMRSVAVGRARRSLARAAPSSLARAPPSNNVQFSSSEAVLPITLAPPGRSLMVVGCSSLA
jgi:hypothetical protein